MRRRRAGPRRPRPRRRAPPARSRTASFNGRCTSSGADRPPFFPTAGGTAGRPTAERVLVLKRERRMLLLRAGEVLREYAIALGGDPVGPKQQRGDRRTPEGEYLLDWRNQDSAYHRAIHISYPNLEDELRAAELGVHPGGGIMIHGLPNGEGWVGAAHRGRDWTRGCIAVTDQEMDEIWELVDDCTPIEIRP